jgi:hypothetical protein
VLRHDFECDEGGDGQHNPCDPQNHRRTTAPGKR